jgi:hypothetical protein
MQHDHDHPHTHGRTHSHDRPVENYSARKHPELVALDIGDDIGALIVHADGHLHGVEVEISRAREDERRSHREVLERSIAGRPAFTAVFDGLTAGTYTLWIGGKARTRGVTIEGGAITQLDWRTTGPDPQPEPPHTGVPR